MRDAERFPNLQRLRRYDQELLLAAVEELLHPPKPPNARVTKSRPGVVAAKYESFCGRCGFQIMVGEDIRFRRPFPGAVHDACHAPTVTVRTVKTATSPQRRTAKTATSQQPSTAKAITPPQPLLCSDCHLEHAGECW